MNYACLRLSRHARIKPVNLRQRRISLIAAAMEASAERRALALTVTVDDAHIRLSAPGRGLEDLVCEALADFPQDLAPPQIGDMVLDDRSYTTRDRDAAMLAAT